MPRTSVELLDGAPQLVEGDVVVEVAGHEPEALGELLPDLLAELGAGVLLDRVVHDLREVLVGPVAPGEADQAEAGRQQPAVGQVVDRRHQLLAGQVAGDAEEHQPAGAGDPGQPPVLRVAQRVDASGSRGCGHASASRSAAQVRPGSVDVQAQHRPAVVGQHLPVADGLGGRGTRGT